LLVLVGEELADEAHGEELDAGEDEEGAQQEEGAVADLVPAEPEDGEVQLDEEADAAEEQADEPEEVHRLALVAGQEHHAEQIEGSAQDPLQPVAGDPVLAGMV